MSLSTEQVKHIAKLAQIRLTDSEVEKSKQELNEILRYVETLSSVLTRGVVATSHVHGVVNVFRDDVVKESLPVEEISKNAPDYGESGFRVPKIIEV